QDVIMPQSMASVFTCSDYAGEAIFVQRQVHLGVRTGSRLRDDRLCDDFERVGGLCGDLQTQVSAGWRVVDTLDLGGERTPCGEGAPMQDQLGCVHGASTVARGNLALTLGEDGLCEAVWPTESIPVIDVQPQRYYMVQRQALRGERAHQDIRRWTTVAALGRVQFQ